MLSACGGLAGVALAYWATQALAAVSAGALTAGTSGPIRLDGVCSAVHVRGVDRDGAGVRSGAGAPGRSRRSRSGAARASAWRHRRSPSPSGQETAGRDRSGAGGGAPRRRGIAASDAVEPRPRQSRISAGRNHHDGVVPRHAAPRCANRRRRSDSRSGRGRARREGGGDDPVPAAEGHRLWDRLLAGGTRRGQGSVTDRCRPNAGS